VPKMIKIGSFLTELFKKQKCDRFLTQCSVSVQGEDPVWLISVVRCQLAVCYDLSYCRGAMDGC